MLCALASCYECTERADLSGAGKRALCEGAILSLSDLDLIGRWNGTHAVRVQLARVLAQLRSGVDLAGDDSHEVRALLAAAADAIDDRLFSAVSDRMYTCMRIYMCTQRGESEPSAPAPAQGTHCPPAPDAEHPHRCSGADCLEDYAIAHRPSAVRSSRASTHITTAVSCASGCT